jgi:L-amino acid N-acyltransferase YncA
LTAEPTRAGFLVRDARPEDLPAIQAMYAQFVLHGLASFEETPPDLAEMTRRFRAALAGGYPYLAAVDARHGNGTLLGYAYAGAYRPRPAYRYTVENSVYVGAQAQGRGVGRSLLATLVERCTALGFRQMVAIIGDSQNLASIRVHESLGFVRVGDLRSVGFKFGRWIDTVVMQRPLGEGDATLPAAAGPPAGG